MKYLEERGIDLPFWVTDNDSESIDRYNEAKKKYGIDPRESMNLDFAFIVWIYNACRMYLEYSVVNMDVITVEVKGNRVTFRKAMNIIIENAEWLLQNQRISFGGCGNKEIAVKIREKFDNIMDALKVVLPYLWW